MEEQNLNNLAKQNITDAPDSKDFDRFIPRVFAVETVLGCDLKCPECAIGSGIITRKKGCMTFEQFKIIADKIRPFCEYLHPHIWGEPLLNKDIFKMLEYASTFTKTNISTNGNLLTEQLAEKLIVSGVSDIIISIDGISQDIYERYRRGGSVSKALWSLQILQQLNVRHGNKVTILPQFLVFKHNQHEMDSFRELCNSIGLTPIYKAPYIRSCSEYQNSDKLQYVRPSYTDTSSLRQAMSKNCKNPREVFTILLDGSCVICCHDHNGITTYGNIYEKGVLDIWNGPKYRQDRLDIVSANAPRYCIENCLNRTLSQPASTASDEFLPEKKQYGRRQIPHYNTDDRQKQLEYARENFQKGNFNKAFDIYEQLSIAYPANAIEILAEVYDQYQLLPVRDRYRLYQSRFYNFGIESGDKVLDIGSGHIPFHLATHLADIAVDDDSYGRAGAPFKHIDGKPVIECNIEDLPFEDKEFDFVYCSHVLEHVNNPQKACDELMHVAKRGYIETPTRGKDIWMNQAKVSNHRWSIENIHNKLIFSEYSQQEIEGLQNDILLNMHCAPQTMREKAFSALVYLKANLFNTMLLWENSFEYEVRHLNQRSNFTSNCNDVRDKTSDVPALPEIPRTAPLRNDKPLKIQLVGTKYGHCAVILDLVAPGSTIISAGVGEDISFDMELIRLKNCQIIGVDPTDKARRYIENNKHPNFHFLQKALYAESDKKIKIYKNTNPDYVSESLTSSHNMVSPSEFYEAETISIPDLLKRYANVSVLKMDIEGAEYDVINSLGELDTPQIYVEFHHVCTDFTAHDTEQCIEHLDRLGYVVTYCKSHAGVPKDMSFIHRNYINQSNVIKMSVKQLGNTEMSEYANGGGRI